MRRTLTVTGLGVAAVGVALTAGQAPAGRSQAQPTFRMGVNFVEVDAVVTDGTGQFLRGLTADDFEVFENGAPQDLSVFSLVDIPVESDDRPLYRAAPVASDVLSNAAGNTGRVYFLLLDDLHVSPQRTVQTRQMALRFVDRYLGANDLAAVIHVGQSGANQGFTISKPLLRRSISQFMGRKLPSRTLNKLADARQQSDAAPPPPDGTDMGDTTFALGPLVDPDAPIRLEYANQMLNTMEDLSRYVSRMQGRRKAFVLFTEGIDYDMEAPLYDSFSGLTAGTEVSSIHGSMRAMLETTMRSNVSIYPVDPRGLGHEMEGIVRIGSLPTNYGYPDGTDPLPRYGLADIVRGLGDELDGSLDSMRTLASETGGFAAINTNSFDRPFQRIVEANSSYYLLGYYPTSATADGSFRRVRVEVKRPGARVSARRGYFAPRTQDEMLRRPESTVAAVREVAASPAESRGLSMRVVPQLLRAPSGMARVHLTLELGPDDLPFREENGIFTNDLLLVWEAVDADGQVRASETRRATMRLRAAAHDRARSAGVNAIAEFDVPAGRYQLRVAALEELGGRSGSVVGDIDVPRFRTATLEMSSLVLSAPSEQFGFAASPGAGALARLLPAPPTARREFTHADRLAVYAEIYDNDARPHTVDLTVRVTADDGREVFAEADERDARELVGVAYSHLVTLPLDQFRPGRYVLTVTARSRLGTEVKRETVFTVR
ncbi:MAG TPA: VWA domain-containing protein [Vicinamibacterales bacterium]|nr:VWA domain-containing protein [Vicinamibacterales bacterium]